MAIFGYALIFSARVIDVTLATIRTLMVVQGRKKQAALIGFFEVGIYVTVLGSVVSNLGNPLNLLAYCLGFATGNIVGITIENKIALGDLVAQIISKVPDEERELVETLRENGFGVTILEGEGRVGKREILHVVLHRKDLSNLRELVYKHDEKAFITVNNINPINGGYFRQIKR